MERRALKQIPGVSYCGTKEEPAAEGEIILLTNTHTRLKNWLHLRSRTAAILHPNSGYDNLLTDLWSEKSIVLGNPIRAKAVSEWTLAALLQQQSFLRHHSAWPADRTWSRQLISERKTLLIGRGHVGKILHTELVSMGIPVTVHDPWLDMRVDLMQHWDTVILACSLNQENRGMISREFLSQQNDQFLLINPARGELVDEPALRDFLKQHPGARAYLDVHAQEPFTPHYWPATQVVATPHVAGVWGGLIQEMIHFEVQAVKAMTQGTAHQLTLLKDKLTPQGFYR